MPRKGTTGDPEALGVQAWGLLLRTHAAVVPRLEQELAARARLSLGWYDVLLTLNRAPERRLRMQDLSERAVLSRTRVSRIVDELARADLVRREPDPTDRRGAYAVLTEAGRQTLRDAAPTYLAAVEEQFSRHLAPAELAALRDGLTRVLQAQTSGAR